MELEPKILPVSARTMNSLTGPRFPASLSILRANDYFAGTRHSRLSTSWKRQNIECLLRYPHSVLSNVRKRHCKTFGGLFAVEDFRILACQTLHHQLGIGQALDLLDCVVKIWSAHGLSGSGCAPLTALGINPRYQQNTRSKPGRGDTWFLLQDIRLKISLQWSVISHRPSQPTRWKTCSRAMFDARSSLCTRKQRLRDAQCFLGEDHQASTRTPRWASRRSVLPRPSV